MAQLIIYPKSDVTLNHSTSGSNGYSVLRDSSDSSYIYQNVTTNKYVEVISSFLMDDITLSHAAINSVTAVVRAMVTSNNGAKVDNITVTSPSSSGKYNDTPAYNTFTDYSISLTAADLGFSTSTIGVEETYSDRQFSISTRAEKTTSKKADFECRISEFYIIVDYTSTITADSVTVNFTFGPNLIKNSEDTNFANDTLSRYHGWAFDFDNMPDQAAFYTSNDWYNYRKDESCYGWFHQVHGISHCKQKTLEGIPKGASIGTWGQYYQDRMTNTIDGFGCAMRWTLNGNLVQPSTYDITAIHNIQTNVTLVGEIYEVAQIRLHIGDGITSATAAPNYIYATSDYVTPVDTVYMNAMAASPNANIVWTIGDTELTGASISSILDATTTETSTRTVFDATITDHFKYIDIYVKDANQAVSKKNQIYIGNSLIKEIYIGTTPIKEVYIGTIKIYG